MAEGIDDAPGIGGSAMVRLAVEDGERVWYYIISYVKHKNPPRGRRLGVHHVMMSFLRAIRHQRI